jgi:16S rRNA (uracil1498-N3)-methyltransferase
VTRHRYRFFATAVHDGVADLSQSDQHHLTDVLRMRVGDTCEVAEGGRVWMARVSSRGLTLMEEVETVAKAPATELGVSAIGALRSDLIKGSFTTARMERWARVAEAAAKQSKQSRVPEILGVARFADVISPEAVVLNLEGASGGLSDRIVGRRSATLLIGPEPGFSDAELALARSRGVAVATFGPVVLRTETAAIVAAALTLREMGFLG